MTSGHPGFLLWAIYYIEIKFSKIENVTMESILNYIYSDDLYSPCQTIGPSKNLMYIVKIQH